MLDTLFLQKQKNLNKKLIVTRLFSTGTMSELLLSKLRTILKA